MSAQSKRIFPCNFEGCLSVFKKHSHLLRHELIHSDKRPYLCTHNGCNASFRSPYHLKRHESTHIGEKQFKCNIDGCHVACITEWNLKRHIKRTHDGPFKCKKCGEEFKKNKQLQQHISMEHKSATVCCDFPGCSAIFAMPSKMKHHMKMHNKGYMCPVKGCCQKFKLWSECRQHTASCKIKEMKCGTCNKVFTNSHNLHAHEKIHNEEREVYQCTYNGCGRFYTKQYNLKVHVQSFHQNIRPFVCPKRQCNKSFYFKHLLRNHLDMHDKKEIDVTKEHEQPKKKRRVRRLIGSTISSLTGYIPELWRRMTPEEIKCYVNDEETCNISDTDEVKDDNFTQKTCTPLSSSELQSSQSDEDNNMKAVEAVDFNTKEEKREYSTEETLTAITTEFEGSEDESMLIYERLKSIEEAKIHLQNITSSTSKLTSSSSTSSSEAMSHINALKFKELNQRLRKLATQRRIEESGVSSGSNLTDSCHVQSFTESESDSEIVQRKMQHCVS